MIIDNDKLKKFFLDYGFTEEQYKYIITSYGVEFANEDTLTEKIKAGFDFFSKYYSNEDIVNIYSKAPSLTGYSVKTLEQKITDLKELGFDVDTIIKMEKYSPQLFTYSIETVKDKIQKIQDIGYKYSEVIDLIIKNPKILGEKPELLEKKITDICTLGFEREEVIQKAKQTTAFYSYSFDTFKERVKAIADIGYGSTERPSPEVLSEGEIKAVQMIKRCPTILNYSKESLKAKIEDLISLEFSKEEVLKMTSKAPSLFGQTIDTLKEKKKGIIDIGFSEEQVRKILVESPTTFGCTTQTVIDKIDGIVNLGYTKEEVMNVVTIYPTILTKSTGKIKDLVEFYDSIGMHELLLKEPKQFMQSVEVSYARYMFFKERGITINMDHYRNLFRSHVEFEERYGISKVDLLKKYNYAEYKEKKKKEKEGLGGLK